MANFHDSYLNGANIEFIEGLYARFLEDPSSVDPSWREIFEKQQDGEGKPIYFTERTALARVDAAVAPARNLQVAQLPQGETLQSMGLQAKVDQAIYAFRLRGHLMAQLDPLERPRPPLSHSADVGLVNAAHFTEAELDQYVDSSGVFPQRRVQLRALIDRLRKTYCSKIGVEFMTLLDSERRRWLMAKMEHSENHVEPPQEEQRHILAKLVYAEGFESFLHTKYVGAKRFSVDGGESIIPMMHAFLEKGGELGVSEVIIGMAHRGRLNVLTNILGKSPDQIFSEFMGPADPSSYLNRGDVKYHQGFSSDYKTRGGKAIHLSLAFNPSHLEAVDPVVEGRVRAKQDRDGEDTADRSKLVPFLIHGDAAFAGQGVVMETLNLSNLKGYCTGGTVHVVINNQVGFTTDPQDSRSSIYCTAIAQMLDVPIFHVNGDDPEACVHVMKLATEFRQQFRSDVVVDVICLRRYGHNEADNPEFTQPKMYELIKKHPTVSQLYAADLVKRGRLTQAEVDGVRKQALEDFTAAHVRIQKQPAFKEPSALEGLWKKYVGGNDSEVPEVETAVPRERLSQLLTKLAQVPEGFTPNPILGTRFIPNRRAQAEGKAPLDWSAGEALAFATLLTEGHVVRLTGQDSERGTFTHRHAVWHDAKTGEEHCPFRGLDPKQAEFRVYNSPLSELGCVGFEYGYSLDFPDALVVWEAQFGDFSNGAQILIDQFLVAGERKWRRLSGMTMLLPHGYEGQWPEHSSARLERFLQLCAEDNIQVAYPSTPAQLFHLLRRQVLRPLRKPLIVMTPKSGLRAWSSKLEELSTGTFQRLIPDGSEPAAVKRLLLCSGKVYWDLAAAHGPKADPTIAIGRVDQLYPFPKSELAGWMKKMTNLEEVYWVQEEPKNMGAWHFVLPLLQDLAQAHPNAPELTYVGRVESASPATGFTKAHDIEQKMIVEGALTRAAAPGGSRRTKNGR